MLCISSFHKASRRSCLTAAFWNTPSRDFVFGCAGLVFLCGDRLPLTCCRTCHRAAHKVYLLELALQLAYHGVDHFARILLDMDFELMSIMFYTLAQEQAGEMMSILHFRLMQRFDQVKADIMFE